MWDFIQAGGFGMYPVMLFGLISLVAAGLFIWRPDPRKVETIRALARSTLYASLVGVCSGLAAVCAHVPENPQWSHSPDIHLIVMIGIGEAMSTVILGFTILSLVWLLMSVGHRRLARRTP